MARGHQTESEASRGLAAASFERPGVGGPAQDAVARRMAAGQDTRAGRRDADRPTQPGRQGTGSLEQAAGPAGPSRAAGLARRFSDRRDGVIAAKMARLVTVPRMVVTLGVINVMR